MALPLATAQQAKLDHVLNKIMLKPGERLLDIGCGWGALAMRAAEKFGAQVVGVTLSKQQFQLARERVAQAGLPDRVDIRLQDYRDLGADEGHFDKITSIGMFEHVGPKNHAAFFDAARRLLDPQGLMLLHTIGLAVGWSLRGANVWVPRVLGGAVAAFGSALLILQLTN